MIKKIKNIDFWTWIEFIGSAMTVIGSFMVANKTYSGFFIYLVAGILLTLWSKKKQAYGLLVMNVCFVFNDCLGIYRNFIENV